jgi:hypothetical protein
MKRGVRWRGGPESCFNENEIFLLTDLGSRKSSYENLIESPKKYGHDFIAH